MTKRLPKDFDLPVKLHPSEKAHEQALMVAHFIPPKARNEAEIARRQGLRPGTLVTEYQYRGLAMSGLIMNQLIDRQSLAFVADTLAPAALNTAWYSFARGAAVMRRRLKLPLLASEDRADRPTTYMLQADAAYYCKQAAEEGMHLVTAVNEGSSVTNSYQIHVARTVGHAGLLATCVPIGDSIGYEMEGVSDYDLQHLARRRGLRALERAQSMRQELGVPPSIAQLADPDSALSVYWRRNAPNEAATLYGEAYETMATAYVA